LRVTSRGLGDVYKRQIPETPLVGRLGQSILAF
jgi:hypothetical protein